MSSSRNRRFKGTTEQLHGSLSKLPGRHRPPSRTEEIMLLRKAYPETYGSKATTHSFSNTRKKLGKTLQPLSNNGAADCSSSERESILRIRAPSINR